MRERGQTSAGRGLSPFSFLHRRERPLPAGKAKEDIRVELILQESLAFFEYSQISPNL